MATACQLSAGPERAHAQAQATMVASCQRCDIDPYAYLHDVIARISDHPANRQAELLPDAWKPMQPSASGLADDERAAG